MNQLFQTLQQTQTPQNKKLIDGAAHVKTLIDMYK